MRYSSIVFLVLITFSHAVDVSFYRSKVLSMFYESYNNYVTNAFPRDELRPLSCDGQETFGSYSLTLVDSLDMLAIVGNNTEFSRAAAIILKSIDLERPINVSVFETNIRVVGGLLSAHLFSKRTGFNSSPGWPCSGPLLDAAVAVARKLLPAFYTKTGMPYGTVNLRDGVPKGETPVTCVASVGTFLVEFGMLSRLTGDPEFERVAIRALYSLWDHRNAKTGLVGNHIDTSTGKWTATDATIGSAVDSYFEYLAKAGVLFDRPDLLFMFHEYAAVIDKYIRKGDWHVMVSMETGQVTWPYFQSLESFWPGVLAITGNINDAIKIHSKYFEIWRQYGSLPEIYDLSAREVKENRAAYPLRPELAESTYYLYRTTRDPFYLEAAATMVDNIHRLARTPCGFASLHNVKDHSLENRMESFWIAETLKYLYLVFDLDNFINSNGATPITFDTPNGQCTVEAGGYVFNTEAHPMDPSAIYCCQRESQRDSEALESALESFDFVSSAGLTMTVDGVDKDTSKGQQEVVEDRINHAPSPDVLINRPPIPPPPKHVKTPKKMVNASSQVAKLLPSKGNCSKPSELDFFFSSVIRIFDVHKMCPATAIPLIGQLLQKVHHQQSTAEKSTVDSLLGWLSVLSSQLGGGNKETLEMTETLTLTAEQSTEASKGEPYHHAHFSDPCSGERQLADCYAAYEVLYNRPAFVCLPVPFYVRHLGIHGVQFYNNDASQT